MNDHKDNETNKNTPGTEPSLQPKGKQQQSDPQLTELKGFTDKNEDLEPTLEDGTKSADKKPPENVNG